MSLSYLERVFEKRFDPSQPRDEEGRWSETPGGGRTLREILSDYVGPGGFGRSYGRVNGYLRGTLDSDIDPGGNLQVPLDDAEKAEIREVIAALDEAFTKAPPLDRDLTVYRGMRFGLDREIKAGDTITDAAYQSTTTNRDFGELYADEDGDLLQITVPRGSRVIDVEAVIGEEGFREQEDEFLLPRGLTLEITKVERRRSGRLIHAKVAQRKKASSYLEAVFDKRFDPSQPRDEEGRWSETPGGGDVLPELAPDAVEADRAVELTERLTDAEAASGARQALRVIGEVHAVPGGAVRTRSGDLVNDTAYGEYDSSLQEIRLNGDNLPNIPQAAETFSHEFGHWLDNRLMKRATQDDYVQAFISDEAFNTAQERDRGQSVLGSEEGDALVPVAQAIYRSDAWKQIAVKEDGKWQARSAAETERMRGTAIGSSAYIGYLARPREAFARAYAQWIASHRPRAFEAHYSAGSEIWTDEDFAPIAEAFDGAFERLGLLKKESDGRGDEKASRERGRPGGRRRVADRAGHAGGDGASEGDGGAGRHSGRRPRKGLPVRRPSSYLEALFKEFDPDQPRDERGRWSETPGGGVPGLSDLAEATLGVDPTKPRQSSPDFEETYSQAEAEKEMFRELLDKGGGVTQRIGADELVEDDLETFERKARDAAAVDRPLIVIPPLKDKNGAREKIARKGNHGDYTAQNLTDLNRGSVLVPHLVDMPEAIREVREEAESQGYTVHAVEDRFNGESLNGYRDVSVLLRSPDGHVSELQFHTNAMWAAKFGEGHRLYEEHRRLTPGVLGRPLTEAEVTQRADLERRSRELYDRAYREQPAGPGHRVSPPEFREAIAPVLDSDLGPFLSDYSEEEYGEMETFLGHDGKVGGAIRTADDGVKEIVSLFNNGGPRGSGSEMAKQLIDVGATRLDNIGDQLRGIYERLGFEVTETIPWDDRYEPAGWDYERRGRPNIYVMELAK